MESLRSNRPLLYSLGISGGTIIVLASGLVPEATEYFEMVPLPDEVIVFSSPEPKAQR